jgi:diguanylate cyclase (GGDEF)-like protein/PAS domain S-box-containing protein
MNKKNIASLNRPNDLRRQAEEIIRGKTPQLSEDLDTLSLKEQRQLLYELRVHQIELEMQNESLRQTQEELESSKSRYFNLYDVAPVGYFTQNKEGLILEANLTAGSLLGVARNTLVKKPMTRFIFRQDQDIYYHHRRQLFETGAAQVCDLRLVKKDASLFWARLESTIVQDSENGDTLYYTVISDIAERKQMEHKLEEMATHDFLTGLPNRALLLDRFAMAAALAHRNKSRLALMSLDLDKFKSINDTFGHDVGDRVLKVVSTRLTGIIRASDTLARVGGDEFILMMLETSQAKDAAIIAQKILDSFTEPLSINGYNIHLSTSIGIAIYPEDAEDLEILTKKSDAAMYYSKDHGCNQFKFCGDGDVQVG